MALKVTLPLCKQNRRIWLAL